MDSLHNFIHQARQKNLTDEQIRQLLHDSGWHETQIVAGLAGLTVPAPQYPEVSQVAAVTTKAPRLHDLNALEAALHHILLWLFTGTTTIMFSIVAYALFGDEQSGVLSAFLVVSLISFLPFAGLYLRYLVKVQTDQKLTTGRIWSVITVVLHSVLLLITVITFILALLLAHNHITRASLITASIAIMILNAIVVVTYAFANFAPKSPYRPWVLRVFPILVLLLLLIFGVIAISHVRAARGTEVQEQAMLTVVNDVSSYVSRNNRLPVDLTVLDASTDTNSAYNITYTVKDKTSYLLCSDFTKALVPDASSQLYDSYLSKSDFAPAKAGTNCWTISSDTLVNQAENN
jgi:hypothetical protein